MLEELSPARVAQAMEVPLLGRKASTVTVVLHELVQARSTDSFRVPAQENRPNSAAAPAEPCSQGDQFPVRQEIFPGNAILDAGHKQTPGVETQVVHFESANLAGSQAAMICHFEKRQVPRAPFGANDAKKPVEFLASEVLNCVPAPAFFWSGIRGRVRPFL